MKRLGLRSTCLAVLLVVASLAASAAGPGVLQPDSSSPLTATEGASHRAALPLVSAPAPAAGGGSLEYGLAFISAADYPASEARYQKALATGAGWNRWPLYWYNVQPDGEGQPPNPDPATWNWSYGDPVVNADLAHGLQTQLILMGTPSFYFTAGDPTIPLPQVGGIISDRAASVHGEYAISSRASPPAGLYQPIFSDGSDVPDEGKTINVNNHWAWFVYHVVDHYSALGITHWEIWNEPDLCEGDMCFWNGTSGDYARLLKVGYLAGKQADPNAVILFGGLANYQKPSFLAEVLGIFSNDQMAPDNNWYFDIMTTHSYSHAWESWYHVWRAGVTMGNYGLSKPIWLNESGSPAWDDYPGPTWDPKSGYRSTMAEGAAYIIQSAMYAKYAGADVIFHFQLYDDCGNDAGGTDFPPLDGDPFYFCQIWNPCAGDAFGLLRNPADGPCYRQHPTPDTARPAYQAYQVLTTHLTELEPFWRQRPGGDNPYNGPQEWIAFYRPATGERVLGMWARFGQDEVAVVPATSHAGILVDQSGAATPVAPVGNTYTLTLPRATNQNLPHAPNEYAIGGPPLILIETDTFPPEVTLSVPALAPPVFEVSWSGSDLGSGLADYDVWLNIDGGPMLLWQHRTEATRSNFTGVPGHTYGFAVVGRDRAGNQGPTPTAPQATAHVTDELFFLPVTLRKSQ